MCGAEDEEECHRFARQAGSESSQLAPARRLARVSSVSGFALRVCALRFCARVAILGVSRAPHAACHMRKALEDTTGNLPPDERLSPLARLERAVWSWHEEHGIFYAANYLRDLRIPRLEYGETEPHVADDESLNALRPGDMVALYHSSFGRFYGVVLDEFDAGELTIATYEWADDDVPLTVATVEWFNVDIIPRSQLDDGWRSIIAGWMRTLGAPDAFS